MNIGKWTWLGLLVGFQFGFVFGFITAVFLSTLKYRYSRRKMPKLLAEYFECERVGEDEANH